MITYAQFRTVVLELLQDPAAYEDGITHPTEGWLRGQLSLYGEGIRPYIISLVEELVGSDGTFAASEFLPILAKVLEEDENKDLAFVQFCLKIVNLGLSSSFVYVRDDAVHFCDLVEQDELYDILASHKDEDCWINEYIQEVLKEARYNWTDEDYEKEQREHTNTD
jgi:hypothetical protein